MMKILCTICARGGTKGLKNKNTRKFLGKPLLFYTISQAKQSKIFDKIIFSSDSNKILRIAKKNKVDLLIKRPKKFATDTIPKIKAVKHALISSENIFQTKFDYIVDLDITAPLRSISDIKKSLNLIKKKKMPCNLIALTPSKKNPYYNMVEVDKKNRVKKVKSRSKNISARQMAPKVYDINPGIYIWNRKGLLKSRDVINNKTLYFIAPNERSVDIDSLMDFKIVKYLFKNKYK